MADPEIAAPLAEYDIDVETLIIGAGACGMIAALAAHEAGQEVLVVEADALPSGSSALSAGLIPAAGTQFQRQAGIDDAPNIFARDIHNKAHGENDPDLETALAQQAAHVIEWLSAAHGLPFSLVRDFDYPGHSRRRMHGLPTRSGSELVDALRTRIEALDISLICNRRADRLYADAVRVHGARLCLPDGSLETVSAGRIILACNGFGGNRAMVTQHMPDIDNGVWFGHGGNQGEAVIWGEELGASTRNLSAFQGHGNVAHPHGILITWAVITGGGFQVNTDGARFWNEAQGYSEAARAVLSQLGGVVWSIFDERIAQTARQFADFKDAERQGAILTAEKMSDLEKMCQIPKGALAITFDAIPTAGNDAFGRPWNGETLKPPFHAVKVTGALFHTQGGLEVDPVTAQVRRKDGGCFDSLYAAGGAACGVSGSGDSGYLSGNGLLAASVLGYIAGKGPASD